MNKVKVASLGLALALCVGQAMTQPLQMPSNQAIEQAAQAAQQHAASVLGQAQRLAKPNSDTGPQRKILPQFNARNAAGVDPAVIAEQYQNIGQRTTEDEAPELIVFVSLSMPEETLKRVAQQARRAGAVMVFRGLKYGLKKGTWTASMNALKPVADTGADIQIHPELFDRYHVTVVPTVVVAAAPQSGCQDDACAAQSAAVVGDVTLDYALERLIDRQDAIGKIARNRVKRLRGG